MHKHVLRAAQAAYPIKTYKSYFTRAKFLFSSLVHKNTLKSFIDEIDAMGYSALFYHEIPLLVSVYSPYIHNEWTVQQRFKAILDHYRMIKKMPNVLNLVDGHPKVLLDLNQYSAGTFISLDKAKWFVREGELVLNLFKDDLRLMSIAFTFSKLDDEFIIYVGAIQGKQPSSETLLLLKEQSKNFEGLRPADLLLEVLRMMAVALGATKILAVSDENRHHRHKHFSHLQSNLLKTNYNEKWLENQGTPLDNGFYSLPIKKVRKDLADIASNKRAGYRRRYSLLDNIESMVHQALQIEKTNSTASTPEHTEANLYPESATQANAMLDIANGQIQLGELENAKETLKKLIDAYPNSDVTACAKKRLKSITPKKK